MTDIHEGHCCCDRCINQLADAILRPPAARERAKPWIIPQDIPKERQTEWHFSNGAKLVFKGGSMDFSEEPTIIEETPAGLREKLDAVNARLAALDEEQELRAIERAKSALEERTVPELLTSAYGRMAETERAIADLDISEAAVIARKRAAGTLSDPETCEHLFSWRIGAAPCRLCGAPPRTPDDEWEPEHWAIVRDGAVVSSGSRPAPDYEAMGYPETAIGECDLEGDSELAILAVRAAVSCIEGSVVLRPWSPPNEKASL